MEIVTLVLAGLACVLSLANLLRRPRGLSGEDLEKVRQDLLAEIRQTRQELSGSVAAGLQASNVQTEQKLESIRTTMEVRLNAMQAVTDRRLGEMRQTVDEKLQKTLEDRLQKSFGLVSQQLELVYKGLGEMRTLAAGVGDLKKVLSNVKTRGILGEVQLGAILEQLLAPGQYAENVATVPGSTERVEFAVRLPGDADGPVWLPIDAKFPQDAYAALLAADVDDALVVKGRFFGDDLL